MSTSSGPQPPSRTNKPDLIDGAIDELSRFHQTFGYYAHGVDETTATLPAGWMERLVPIHNENTGGATGWCVEVHDPAVSKLVAGREKDLVFVHVLLQEHMAAPAVVRDRLGMLPLSSDLMALLQQRLLRLEVASRDGLSRKGPARE